MFEAKYSEFSDYIAGDYGSSLGVATLRPE
jgi:hypothetical protein